MATNLREAYSVLIFLVFSCVLLNNCASTTEAGSVGLERKQFFLVSSEEIEGKSAEAYEQIKRESRAKNTLDRNTPQLIRIQNIAKRLIPNTAVFRRDALDWKWEVHLQANPELNAFCMPGGKIMFYSGIIDSLQLTDGEIAAVMGHEISHALREHGREQMSEQIVKMGLLELGVETGLVSEKYANALLALSELMISLPHSRGQESEADILGLELMARSGYNPEDAISLWNKMSNQGGGKPPEFISTHPSDESRIKNIRNQLSKVMPLYNRLK